MVCMLQLSADEQATDDLNPGSHASDSGINLYILSTLLHSLLLPLYFLFWIRLLIYKFFDKLPVFTSSHCGLLSCTIYVGSNRVIPMKQLWSNG